MCVRSKFEDINESLEHDISTNTKRAMLQNIRKKKRLAMLKHQEDVNNLSCKGNSKIALTGSLQPIQGQIKEDVLTISTRYYRIFLTDINEIFARFHESKAYKILFHTTQPAHVVTLVAVATIASLVFPRQDSNPIDDQTSYSSLMKFIYLASLMIHYGAQMWMTFVSGLSLYFALPRHTFGGVQRVLFPKYFGINSFLSLVTLIVFIKLHPTATWDSYMIVQVCALVLCFLIELVILLYLTPPLLALMTDKNKIEKEAGVGLEVGENSVGSLALCPHYLRLHRAFRKVHISVAMGNMVTMGCTTLHLWYLSNKICF